MRKADVYYEGEDFTALVATIRLEGGEIGVEMFPETFSRLPFDRNTLDRLLTAVIDVPLRRCKLRHKTMPQHFSELVSGSARHFQMMERRYGAFNVICKI